MTGPQRRPQEGTVPHVSTFEPSVHCPHYAVPRHHHGPAPGNTGMLSDWQMDGVWETWTPVGAQSPRVPDDSSV